MTSHLSKCDEPHRFDNGGRGYRCASLPTLEEIGHTHFYIREPTLDFEPILTEAVIRPADTPEYWQGFVTGVIAEAALVGFVMLFFFLVMRGI